MDIPAEPLVDGAPRGIRTRSMHKRTAAVIATFFLATAFTVAGAPAATALNLNYDCNGESPGWCPPPRNWR